MRWVVAGVVAWAVGCGGGADRGDALGASSTGGLNEDGTDAAVDSASDDPPSEPLPDLPPSMQSCEERGTVFGIVAGPRVVEGAFDPVSIDHVAATAGASGLLTTYARYNRDVGVADYLAVRIGTDGSAKGSPWSLSLASDTPEGFGREDRLLLTYCEESQVGWRAFELAGGSLGPNLGAPAYGECGGHPPAAAWTDSGYLVAWRSMPSPACPDGCIALAFGNENVVFSSKPIADSVAVTDPLAIAVASEAALVATPHITAAGSNEILASLLQLSGAPLFPPIRLPVASLSPTAPDTDMPVGVAATEDDGFLLVVGGRGAAIGRIRIDEIASVVEAYTDLPLPDELGDVDAYRTELNVARRTGGFVVSGRVTSDILPNGLLLTMLDERGDITSHELFSGASDGAVVTYDDRTFVVYGGETLSIAELGCVF